MIPFRLYCVAALAGLSFFVGCGTDDNPVTPGTPGGYQSIAIFNGGDTLLIGETVQFTATVTDTAGDVVTSPALTWGTSNTNIATVDNLGRVTGRGEGTATITATGGGILSNAVVQIVVQGFGWVDQSDANLSLQTLRGVHFADVRRGWAVGDQGTIIATTDAGVTWRKQNSLSTQYRLNAVYFPTASHGFVVGSAGRILETHNGGSSWTARGDIDTGGGLALNDIFFVNQIYGFIVGNSGIVLRTKDGGDEWERYDGSLEGDLDAVWATDDPGPNIVAWAVGSGGRIVGTLNGGDIWSIYLPAITSVNLRGVAMRTSPEAVAVGVQNTVGVTNDAGGPIVWSLIGGPSDFTNFEDVAWPIGGDLWASGENTGGRANVLRSTDGGLTWTTEVLPGDAPLAGRALYSVWFVDPFHGWAVGEQGLILHTATGGER